ncbi:hypothetical protein FG477_00820, partial [Xylella fastidiosa subsp. multiplex]|uniref:hypothetical protein n=1 Tax=Xylella fastidiosa TaxID=2371 RepID=UPI0012AD080D
AAGIIQSGTDGGANAGGARWTITVTDLITTSDVYRLVNAPGNQVNVSGAVTATTVADRCSPLDTRRYNHPLAPRKRDTALQYAVENSAPL